MNGIIRFAGLLLCLITLSFWAQAREGVPIVNYDNVLVTTGSGNAPSVEQVRAAIANAARINKWIVSQSADQNVLSASLLVKGKHMVVVSIPYSAEKFSIRYQDSMNMNYRVSGPAAESSSDLTKINRPAPTADAGAPTIHPAYNQWVGALLQSIRLELAKI